VKILIWQTAYLGDVILTTPLIKAVKERLKPEKVTFAGRPFILELFRGWDLHLLPFNKGTLESLRAVVRIRGYDVALVPHRSLRSALIIFFSGIPLRIGFDRSELKWAFNRVIPHRWDLHEVDRNLSLLSPLGVPHPERELFLPISEEERRETLKKFGLTEGEYLVINPFANFPLKEWHLEGWKRLINLLRTKVVVVGLAKDVERSRELERSKEVVNLTGRTSLRELMGVISGARLLLSCDSSPVHMANALGVPAITIYTSTSPSYGFYPLIGGYVTNPAPCSPCSPNPKKCRSGTYECLGSITAEAVFEKVKELL
jgi:heptosyltransferase-2